MPPPGPNPRPPPLFARSGVLVSLASVTRSPPGRAASRRSRGTSRELSMSSSCVPMPAMRAVVHDDDPVGVHDRAHALRDDDHRRLARLVHERRAQPRVGLEVQRREAVVEDVDLRALHERARDGEALTLAAGDVGAALRDRGVELLGHLGDELRALRDLERAPQLVLGGVLVAVAQVARHRAGEQERPLRDEADLAPQVFAAHLAHVDAVDEHAAAGHVVEARDQVDERATCRCRCCRRSPSSPRASPRRRCRTAPGPRRRGSGTRRPGTRCSRSPRRPAERPRGR